MASRDSRYLPGFAACHQRIVEHIEVDLEPAPVRIEQA
jgi:hypothetical protein